MVEERERKEKKAKLKQQCLKITAVQIKNQVTHIDLSSYFDIVLHVNVNKYLKNIHEIIEEHSNAKN